MNRLDTIYDILLYGLIFICLLSGGYLIAMGVIQSDSHLLNASWILGIGIGLSLFLFYLKSWGSDGS